jgi:hypothetical protein
MKIRKVSFDTEEEMEEVITADNYKFSKYIVDQAFYHLTSSESEISILEIETVDTNTTFDIILEPKHMVETLESNLPVMEKHEDYETCKKIVDSIDFLKSLS